MNKSLFIKKSLFFLLLYKMRRRKLPKTPPCPPYCVIKVIYIITEWKKETGSLNVYNTIYNLYNNNVKSLIFLGIINSNYTSTENKRTFLVAIVPMQLYFMYFGAVQLAESCLIFYIFIWINYSINLTWLDESTPWFDSCNL